MVQVSLGPQERGCVELGLAKHSPLALGLVVLLWAHPWKQPSCGDCTPKPCCSSTRVSLKPEHSNDSHWEPGTVLSSFLVTSDLPHPTLGVRTGPACTRP